MSTPGAELLQSEHIRRRRAINWFVEILATLSALLAVAVLVIVIASVAKRGAGAIDLNFLTKTPSPELLIGGTGPTGSPTRSSAASSSSGSRS